MAAVTPLIDTLLATRLAQRPDLLTSKGQTEVGLAQRASAIDKAGNDVRLPSRAALGQLAGRPAGATQAGAAGGMAAALSSPGSAAAITLGPAARAIGEVLSAGRQAAPAVRGSAPIWSSSLPPTAPLLAKALARAVTTSGLFYESHLRQYASGARSLAELQREPQARFPVPPLALAQTVTPAAASVPVAAPSSPPTPAPSQVPAAASAAVQELSALLPEVAALEPQLPQTGSQPPAGTSAPSTHVQPALSPGGAVTGTAAGPASEPQPRIHPAPERLAAAYGGGEASASLIAAGVQGDVRAAEPAAAGSAGEPGPRAAAGAAANHPAVIHFDAVTLVHQQLDLLELGVFRWSGEPWPGASMQWEIRKEVEDGESAADQPTEAAWRTTLQLSLPALGAVEVRLSLASGGLQARVVAQTDQAVELLGVGRANLAQRLSAAGLPLVAWQVLNDPASKGQAG